MIGQEDYFKRQIDMIGRMLGKIISNILLLKKQGRVGEGFENVSQTLKNELDFNIDEIIDSEPDKLISFLVKEKGFSNENIEKLADILMLIADDTSEDKEKLLYEKCLTLYEYVDKTDTTYSLSRKQRIEEIQNILL